MRTEWAQILHNLNLFNGPNKACRLSGLHFGLSAFLGLSTPDRAKPAHDWSRFKLIVATTHGNVAIEHHDTALVLPQWIATFENLKSFT